MVGVLALQGAFDRHLAMVRSLGYRAMPFREREELASLDALIIPGGESTTMTMLLKRRDLFHPLAEALKMGLPVFGTCAGAILLAREIVGTDQESLEVMDISIRRNAYGSQVDSFEAHIDFRLGERSTELESVFIRAPEITRVGTGLEVLGSFNGAPVLVRQGTRLASSFHPELTRDPSIHRFFLGTVAGLKP